MPALTQFQIRPLVEAALAEDIRSGDVTTSALIPSGLRATAAMNFRVPGVVCGLDLAAAAFRALDPEAAIEILSPDGTQVNSGTTVFRVRGQAAAILTAERVSLNFAQRLSAIATLTNQFVQTVQGTGTKIIDTRKTTPGLRLVEKYAVRCGGGFNHRFALDDMVLVKDNHIALCGGIQAAVEKARGQVGHSVKVEVECDTLKQVREAVAAGADIILLDNMPPAVLSEAVEIIGGRAVTEASGGVNLDTVRAIAESGVHLISIGAITHGVRSLDIGLDVEFE